MSDTNEFLRELWDLIHPNVDVQTRVALKLDELDRRIAQLEAENVHLVREVQQLEAALRKYGN